MRWIPLLVLLTACDEAPTDPLDEELAVDEAPPVNPAIAVGRTYVLDPATRQFTGSLTSVAQMLAGASLSPHRAFTVFAHQGGDLLVRFGTVDRRQQDVCALTTDIPLQRTPGAAWGAQQQGLNGFISDTVLPYEDATLAGRLDPGGRSVSNIHFTATADLRAFVPLGLGDPCTLLQIVGLTCFACADGTPNCLDVSFEHAVANEIQMPRLALVDAASRAAHGCP